MYIPTVAEFLEMDTRQQVEVMREHLTEVVWPHVVADPEKLELVRRMVDGLTDWLRDPVMREVLPDQAMRDRCILYHRDTMLGGGSR